ncbi:MAG TPA: FAD-dependent oxidoreductase [Gemmatimonas sp.]|nr:FAD-dependent oxidoreductase [Gemmatimonas sp.]
MPNLPSTNDDMPRPDDSATDRSNATGDDVMPRREFLLAGVSASAALALGCATVPSTAVARGIEPNRRGDNGVGHVVVIGAGVWGSWTAYHLRKRGARVTLVDAYGPGNSRATSGDETRGIRSSYGDRSTVDHWTAWARTSIARWQQFDDEYGKEFHTKFFHKTGDVIMRATDEPFVKNTLTAWKAQGVPHEVMNGDEARKRWPMIKADDITIALYEPDAGVVRARAATQAVAAAAQMHGVKFVLGRVRPGQTSGGKLQSVLLEDGTAIRGDAYVFACGPWLRKLFPELLMNRMRVPLGYVCYFGTPLHDHRFTFPNLPSYNFPGVTGWPSLPVDMRGFRVRGALAEPSATTAAAATGARAAAPATPPATTPAAGTPAATTAAAPRPASSTPPADPLQSDPDTSVRWSSQERIDGSRRFLEARFPALAKAPILETRSCHYESSINRDFIIDTLPNLSNAWIAGVGQAEGFKFGPVVGEYVAQRVLGIVGDPKLVAAFKMPTEQYET